MFQDQLTESSQNLVVAHKENDIIKINEIAHKLKGASAQLGITYIEKVAKELNYLDEKCDVNIIQDLINQICTMSNQFENEMITIINEIK